MIRGLIITLKLLGIDFAIKEIFRRLFGISYSYNGIKIDSRDLFKFMIKVASYGFYAYRSNREIIVSTDYGEIGVDAGDYNLLSVLFEPLKEQYECVDLKDAVVIDLGAFIGETPLFFLSRGARKVYAFEPVEKFYRYLERNILRNKAEDKVVVNNIGAWFHDGILQTSLMHTGTGLETDGQEITSLKVKSLDDILKFVHEKEGRIDLVKMDCEGCEYSLLIARDEILRLPKHYIIEIHGCETPIIYRMTSLGYERKLIMKHAWYLKTYLFTRRR